VFAGKTEKPPAGRARSRRKAVTRARLRLRRDALSRFVWMYLREGAGHSSPRRARTRGNAAENTLLSSVRFGGVLESRPYRVEKQTEKFFGWSGVKRRFATAHNSPGEEDSRQRFFESAFSQRKRSVAASWRTRFSR
jgi:hypothetical protein